MNITDIPNLRHRGKIVFKSTDYHNDANADKVDTLIDDDINKHTNYGVLVSCNPKSHFEFTIYNTSNIWAYGQSYSDGGGYTPKSFNLYKLNDFNEFELFLSDINTQSNKWYLLFNKLKPGTYKIKGVKNYIQFTEWYVEVLGQYLLYKNNIFYTTSKSLYGDKHNRLVKINNNEANIKDNLIQDIYDISEDILNNINDNYSIIKI